MAKSPTVAVPSAGPALTQPRSNLYIGIYIAVAGLLAIVFFAVFAGGNVLIVLGVCLALALAALVLGLFLGFLFGIPRAGSGARVVDPAAAAAPAGAPLPAVATPAALDPDHRVNTNLEDISDWLTKIIVGVSLVELRTIGDFLTKLGTLVQTAFSSVNGIGVFSEALLVLFFFIGVLFGFLWTRLELQLAIGDSDRLLLGLRQRLKRDSVEAGLLDLLYTAIQTTDPVPDVDTFKKALAGASRDVRTVVFYRAREFRQNMRSSGDLETMTRVIPIFEALIAVDKEEMGGDGRYHRNYAQLAYTQKDSSKHEYQKAVDNLTLAITLRDTYAAKERLVYLKYEFNRACSRIEIDENFASNTVADRAVRDLITADLTVAITDPLLLQWATSDATVMAWLSLNGWRIEGTTLIPQDGAAQ